VKRELGRAEWKGSANAAVIGQVPRLALRIAWLAVYFGLLFVIHVGGLNTHASD
jgi:hypothetical protein